MHAKHAGDSRAHSVVGIVAAVPIAVALAVGTAGADAIVYDNGEVDPSLWGSVSEMGFGYGAFDDFVLSEGANTITGITWWGSYESETEDKESLEYDIREFRVSIYDRLPAGDQMDPWLPLYEVAPAPVTRSDTDMHMDSGERIFVYSTSFAAVELTPEKPYYLSIFSLDDAHWDPRWVWCGARPGTSWHYEEDFADFGVWWQGDRDLAFHLTGPGPVVPEPGSLLLLGTGVAGLAAYKRRRP